ncbi:MAG TPA: hypothetical protein PKD53_04645 [Chloroflexaceae bacterium]|nr:hypothetical protein [Chloroflexaceae bacterium]
MSTIPVSHRHRLAADGGILATAGTDGNPQVTALSCLHDDGRLKISLNTSRKVHRHQGRVTPA